MSNFQTSCKASATYIINRKIATLTEFSLDPDERFNLDGYNEGMHEIGIVTNYGETLLSVEFNELKNLKIDDFFNIKLSEINSYEELIENTFEITEEDFTKEEIEKIETLGDAFDLTEKINLNIKIEINLSYKFDERVGDSYTEGQTFADEGELDESEIIVDDYTCWEAPFLDKIGSPIYVAGYRLNTLLGGLFDSYDDVREMCLSDFVDGDRINDWIGENSDDILDEIIYELSKTTSDETYLENIEKLRDNYEINLSYKSDELKDKKSDFYIKFDNLIEFNKGEIETIKDSTTVNNSDITTEFVEKIDKGDFVYLLFKITEVDPSDGDYKIYYDMLQDEFHNPEKRR